MNWRRLAGAVVIFVLAVSSGLGAYNYASEHDPFDLFGAVTVGLLAIVIPIVVAIWDLEDRR
jgi:hypothetical protein